MKIKWNARSIVGLILVIIAVFSLLLDVAGVVQVWMLRGPVTQDAINTLDLLNSTLDTTSQGLAVAKASLQSVTATIGVLQDTVSSAAATIANASNSVNSLSGIVGNKLSETVTSALGTLDVVQSTAQTVDEVLGGLSKLPFVNIPYTPEQSLSASVGDLSDKLSQVPQSLSDLEANLANSGSSLDQVGNDANSLAASLGQVESDMAKLVSVIEQYESQVKAFQGTIQNLRANIVTIIWGIVLFLTFILLWLAATMVMTLWKGLEWMGIQPKWFEAPKTEPT